MSTSFSAVPGLAIFAEAVLGVTNHDAPAAVPTAPQVRIGTFKPTFTVSCSATVHVAQLRAGAFASASAARSYAYAAVPGQAVFGVAVLGEPLFPGTPPMQVNAVAAQVRSSAALSATSSPTATPASGIVQAHATAPVAKLTAFPPAARISVGSAATASATATVTVPKTPAVRVASSEITSSVGAFAAGGVAAVTIRSRATASSSANTTIAGRQAVRVRSTAPSVTATSNPTAIAGAAQLRTSSSPATLQASQTSTAPTARVTLRSQPARGSLVVSSTNAAVRVNSSRVSVSATTGAIVSAPAARINVRAGTPTVTASIVAFTILAGRTNTSQLGGIVRPMQADTMSTLFGTAISGVPGESVPGGAVLGELLEVV